MSQPALYDEGVVPTRRKPRVKTVRSLALSLGAALVVVALAGAPAGAATPVVADDQFKWYYWVGPILALSFLGMMLALVHGYYVRVLRPKWRGRRQPS